MPEDGPLDATGWGFYSAIQVEWCMGIDTGYSILFFIKYISYININS